MSIEQMSENYVQGQLFDNAPYSMQRTWEVDEDGFGDWVDAPLERKLWPADVRPCDALGESPRRGRPASQEAARGHELTAPSKYRKRPLVIDAIQWTGGNLDKCRSFLGDSYDGIEGVYGIDPSFSLGIGIATLEGRMVAPLGHWLIRGVKGEHYSCAPDIFEATYEPAPTSRSCSDGR